MSSDTIDAMLQNHQAESWEDVREGGESLPLYDDPRASPLERVQDYVDHCFDVYDVVSNHLDRDKVQCVVARWDRRRGQHWPNRVFDKQVFNKQVRKSHHIRKRNHSVVLMAVDLVGVAPENDKGVGWKATVRHELGHAIDHAKRGCSDHSKKFKKVMRAFGEGNDGMSQHGFRPDVHRRLRPYDEEVERDAQYYG